MRGLPGRIYLLFLFLIILWVLWCSIFLFNSTSWVICFCSCLSQWIPRLILLFHKVIMCTYVCIHMPYPSMWKFLGQGSNLWHNSKLSHCSDNPRSLTQNNIHTYCSHISNVHTPINICQNYIKFMETTHLCNCNSFYSAITAKNSSKNISYINSLNLHTNPPRLILLSSTPRREIRGTEKLNKLSKITIIRFRKSVSRAHALYLYTILLLHIIRSEAKLITHGQNISVECSYWL